MTQDRTTFLLGTYNILRDGYIRPEYYPRTDPADLLAVRRHPRLLQRIQQMNVDALCLQEVDELMAGFLKVHLRGTHTLFWSLGQGRPDGCMILVRKPWCIDSDSSVCIDFEDGYGDRPASGRRGLLTTVTRGKKKLVIANIHLKWDDPNMPKRERLAPLEAEHLIRSLPHSPEQIVICGDFNAEPDSDILRLFHEGGFWDTHSATTMTCNPGGRAKKVDYVLYKGSAFRTAVPIRTRTVKDDTALPSSTEASDHVDLCAKLEW